MKILEELNKYFYNKNKVKDIIAYYKSTNVRKLFAYKRQWERILSLYKKNGYSPHACNNRHYCKEECCFADECGNSNEMPISFSNITDEGIYYAMIELCNMCIANKNIVEI